MKYGAINMNKLFVLTEYIHVNFMTTLVMNCK